MRFKLLIPITLITILAFNSATQAAPVPQNVSESIISEEVPTISNSSTISNRTIEATATFISSLVNDDYESSHFDVAEYRRKLAEKNQSDNRIGLIVVLVFVCSLVCVPAYAVFFMYSYEVFLKKQYENFFEMIKYIKEDDDDKGQSWLNFLKRVIFSWRTLGIFIISIPYLP
ncbi:putative membrane protein [Wickerhamomyces ciferrii]|uniref:Membrane protein n=1 Tax=Wickerhamomyces ciferrii (strain ATCC 14091 / BCRC 22168 / CBS 111 / JCM 3599 / NBRC 0793 / NRRL Y-1031 F-60-10) TaxID=1206466 RepID=K0KWV3_WICCF|nr:uncharacterized protein BN7_5556 [Wickerhamomyces ciferrii]CCH45969.1 putative membrane protein [Wickerhamomyces ciferrii]